MLQYVNGTKEFKLRLKVHGELKVILSQMLLCSACWRQETWWYRNYPRRAIDAEQIKQKLVATSSAESELVTLAGAVMVATN